MPCNNNRVAITELWLLKYEIWKSTLLNFWIISTDSFDLRSAVAKVRKEAGAPNRFTIASTSDLDFFQYAGVALIEFINPKAWWFSRYCCKVSWKLALFNKPALNFGAETFRFVIVIYSTIFLFCNTFRTKKI